MKFFFLIFLTISSSSVFAASGDLSCTFQVYNDPGGIIVERFTKTVALNTTDNLFKLGELFVGVKAEQPKNSALSNFLTLGYVGFLESEKERELSYSSDILIGGSANLSSKFYFNRPSPTLHDTTEHYLVLCSRLDK